MDKIIINHPVNGSTTRHFIKNLFLEHPSVEHISVDANGRFMGWLLKFDKPSPGPDYDKTWYSGNHEAYYNKDIKPDFCFADVSKHWRYLFFSRHDYVE